MLYRGDGRPERGPWDAWTLLAGLATVTERVALGPLVACTAFRRPSVLAHTVAAVDELSGGRLVLALGAGWNEPEFRAFGIPFDHRVERFAEALEIVRRLLGGERVTFAGEYEAVSDAVLLPAPSRSPPLMLGATGPRMLAVGLPHVDAWNTWYDVYGNTPEGFAALNRRIDDAARDAGRDPAQIERSACALVVLDRAAGERPIPEGLSPVEGSSERIAAHLRELAEAGADEAILVVSPIDERSVRALGDALAALDR
jgi:alkanesulfonate monooxygenase SsuD/methylene tetrahydromethanopterin reductase-like flavin-dependent oxidoreductase (luciferase family)